MTYLLDTCVLSEFKKKLPEPKVISWLDSHAEESMFLSVLTIGELQKGISFLPNSKRRDELEVWLENTIYRYDNRVLPLDVKTMRQWGRLTGRLEKKGRVLPMIDSMIAATSQVHEMTLVTRNEQDFAGTGVTVLNIWK